jgi:NADPH-dependent curcumin reductase CurA
MNRMNRRVSGVGIVLVTSLVSASVASPAVAYRGGGGARPANVNNARSSVSNHNVNVNHNVNTNVNRNTNVNVNRNVDVHGGYGYGGYGGYDHWGHPVAAAAVAVTATAVAVGTIAAALPPSGCSAVSIGGIGYQRCGPNYYQPVTQGGTVQYVVVAPP